MAKLLLVKQLFSMKRIDITEVKVKEIRIGINQGKLDGLDYYDVSVLYSQKPGVLPYQWSDPIKGDKLQTILKNRIVKVVEKAVEEINSVEGVV